MNRVASTALIFAASFLNSCGQKQFQQKNTVPATQDTEKAIAVGGPCDNCNIMFEGMPPLDRINSETTIAGNAEPGERMEISGMVYLKDGKTPAKDIVLYAYHTNAAGLYQPSDTQTLGRRNGRLRGWVKTNSEGKFSIASIRPAPYPQEKMPAHIHFLVKEPKKTVYYIDEVWFTDDKLVTEKLQQAAEKRGGDLIIALTKNDKSVWLGNLTITLGLNIPGYP